MTDRGVSSTLEYVFGIAIATLLLGALISGTGGLVASQQEQAVQSELEVLGQRLAADLASADRLARTDASVVEMDSDMPIRVAATQYDVEINASATESEIVLETDDPDVSITVGFSNTTDVEPTTVRGGDLQIVLSEDGHLEVREA